MSETLADAVTMVTEGVKGGVAVIEGLETNESLNTGVLFMSTDMLTVALMFPR